MAGRSLDDVWRQMQAQRAAEQHFDKDEFNLISKESVIVYKSY